MKEKEKEIKKILKKLNSLPPNTVVVRGKLGSGIAPLKVSPGTTAGELIALLNHLFNDLAIDLNLK